LADIAFDLFDWWDTIDTARSHVAQHPKLFMPEASEPPAAPEPAQPSVISPAKGRRARKSRKQGRHA
jgi:hypothetical protein